MLPNEDAQFRQVGSIPMDINEERVTGRRYSTMKKEWQTRRLGTDKLQKI